MSEGFLRLSFWGLIFKRAYLFIYITFFLGGGGLLLEFYRSSFKLSDRLHSMSRKDDTSNMSKGSRYALLCT